MRRCAYLTLADSTGFVIDDDTTREPLAELGWDLETVVWNAPARWDDFDVVVVRSPWDYWDRIEEFRSVLHAIDASSARLENPLSLMIGNLEKTYLRELASGGVPIVPTIWRGGLGPGELRPLLEELDALAWIAKPTIAGSASGAYRLVPPVAPGLVDEVEDYFANRAVMVQPFVQSVLDEGEYSLFYFDGYLSHAVLKRPAAGDFRVQEEHGGAIAAVTPDGALREAASRVMAALPRVPLYARVDLVRGLTASEFWLMELELVDPALYLSLAPGAPARFARALDQRFQRVG